MAFFTITLIGIFCIFAFILSFIDIKQQKIPRFLSFSFIGIIYGLRIFEAIVAVLISSKTDESLGFSHFIFAMYSPSLGLMLGFVVFYAIRVLTKKKLGLADVWFSAGIGTFLGYLGWYFAIAIACLMALVWIFSFALVKKIRSPKDNMADIAFFKIIRTTKIPFIPFLSFGSLCTLLISSLS